MKVLLDLNIWIDIAARRKSFPESRELLRHLQMKHYEVCFPLSTYTTFHYILCQLLGKKPALIFCKLLYQRKVSFLPFGIGEIERAQALNFTDQEDACVAASALNHNCDLIITRDKKGFRNSPVECMTPKELLAKMIP